MPLNIVDSTQCHLWTDALHLRALAKQTSNRWDRGTYVRMSVLVVCTALEVACQDALDEPGIGYSFARDLDRALMTRKLAPIDWGRGVWQEARALQALRNSYVHRFATLEDMFPDAKVADQAIHTVRHACADIFSRASKSPPGWIELDTAAGWVEQSQFGLANLTSVQSGASSDDPSCTRVCFVTHGQERLFAILKSDADSTAAVDELLASMNVPISEVRVYSNGVLTRSLRVNMRGNAP